MASQASKLFLKSIGAPDYSDRLGGETFMSLVKAKRPAGKDVSEDKLKGSDRSRVESRSPRAKPAGTSDDRLPDFSDRDGETGEVRHLGHPDNPNTKHLPRAFQSAALTGVLHEGAEQQRSAPWSKEEGADANRKSLPEGAHHPNSKYYPAYLFGRAQAAVGARVKSNSYSDSRKPFGSPDGEQRTKQLDFSDALRPGTIENVGNVRQRWDGSTESARGADSPTSLMQALRAEKNSHIDGPSGKVANMHHTPAGEDDESSAAQQRSRTVATTFLKGAPKAMQEAQALNRITAHFVQHGGYTSHQDVIRQSHPLGDYNHRELPTPVPIHLGGGELEADHPAATFPHLLKDAPAGYHDPVNEAHEGPMFHDYKRMLEDHGVKDHGVGTARAALEHIGQGGIDHVQAHIGSKASVASPRMAAPVAHEMLSAEKSRSKGTIARFGKVQIPPHIMQHVGDVADHVDTQAVRSHSATPDTLVGPPREGGARAVGQVPQPAKAPKPSAGKKTAAPKIGKVKTPKAASTSSPAPKQSGAAPGLFDGMLGSDGKIA